MSATGEADDHVVGVVYDDVTKKPPVCPDSSTKQEGPALLEATNQTTVIGEAVSGKLTTKDVDEVKVLSSSSQVAAAQSSFNDHLREVEAYITKQETIFRVLRERLAALADPQQQQKPNPATAALAVDAAGVRPRPRTATTTSRLLAAAALSSPGSRPSTSTGYAAAAQQRTPVQSRVGGAAAARGGTRASIAPSSAAGSPAVVARVVAGRGVARSAATSAAAAPRRPPTGRLPRKSTGEASDTAATGADGGVEPRSRSLTRQRSVDRWNVDSRLKELEDIRASNSQAMERTNSTFSRTHSLRRVSKAPTMSAVSPEERGLHPLPPPKGDGMLDDGLEGDEAPSYTEYLRRASAVSAAARRTPRRLSTAKIVAKTPRAAMARIVRAMVVSGAAPPIGPSSSKRAKVQGPDGSVPQRTAAASKDKQSTPTTGADGLKRPQWQSSTTRAMPGRAPGVVVTAGSRKSTAAGQRSAQ